MVGMTGWLGIVIGVFLLVMVFADRGSIRDSWRSPARWWVRREYQTSREPSQPLNVILGVVLGLAALIYGIVTVAGG